MSNNVIDLTHIDQSGCMIRKIEYTQTSKIIKERNKNIRIKESTITYYTDPNQKLSIEQLRIRTEHYQNQYKNILNSNKQNVDHRAQVSIVNKFLNSVDDNQHHMLITWTYPKKFGWRYENALEDIFAIRSRIIKLLFPNFKPKLNNRRDDCPRMYFFAEKHSDGQYHIHLLMETIEPDLLATCLDRDSFRLRWEKIINKINKRKLVQQMVITPKMINRWADYKHHPFAGKTFDQIKSHYDEWKVARFICDYISHYKDEERWGLNRISNSPENNHSKVIESKTEIHSKCSYLNKDRYFIDKDDDFLRHIVPEYSDF